MSSSSWCTGDDSCRVAEHYPDKSYSGPHRGDSMSETVGEAPLDAAAFDALPGTEHAVDLDEHLLSLAHEPDVRPDPVNMVDHPPHYKSAGGLEVIDVIEAFDLGFRLGNAVKYVLRAGKKGDRVEDLKKARWYLDREIMKLEQS